MKYYWNSFHGNPITNSHSIAHTQRELMLQSLIKSKLQFMISQCTFHSHHKYRCFPKKTLWHAMLDSNFLLLMFWFKKTWLILWSWSGAVMCLIALLVPRNFTPSCSWDDEADCQKYVVCYMCRSMFAKFTCRP